MPGSDAVAFELELLQGPSPTEWDGPTKAFQVTADGKKIAVGRNPKGDIAFPLPNVSWCHL
eukprot:CAMPEP_0198584540 /NCGR_PEP_ID=MMETSP1462-20131121/128159_1 /TAXON_ID=1333877 /ORGANISM="Brandtodinium nutriculum, Strain RCC3387" /LENGTH=60 /DNA_ID=CAMNT_0044315955 /DNA_START=24 /DNA_END=203 /DNA_ORIENTATION=-